ncbi:MAG: sensor histidine kinase [Gaiellales bacterium]
MEQSAVRRIRRPRRAALDEHNRELAALLANVPGAIYRCALDADWTMAVISEEIERISGYPASDFVHSARRTFGSIINPHDRDDVGREVRAATEDDRPFALEYRIVRADGATVWVLERGQQVVDADGELWLHGVIFDITERRRAEEELRRQAAEQARETEMRAARGRVIAAQDTARRQIERDLHDGAQQQLVSLCLMFRTIRTRLPADDPELITLVEKAIAELARATAELRDLARGMHPAVLTDLGLPAATQVLASRAVIPVDVDCALSERLPADIETAAYYVVAESLTNAARHARASRAAVRLERQQECLVVEVSDDGLGGADPQSGSGLRGLSERIDALEGTLDVTSDAGHGTCIQARIPVAPTAAMRPDRT